MPVIKLTQDVIDQLTCPEGKRRIEYCDGKGRDAVPGLYIEVRSTSPGQGTFYARYKVNGKTCHQKLGRTTDISLDTARTMAKKLRAEIDPSADKKAAKDTLTFTTFFEDHYLPFAKQRKRTWKRDQELFTKTFIN